MQKFKQIREATQYNPYAIGMAAAKQAAGMGTAPAENLPKSVITKGHEIAKKIKANESFDEILSELELETELAEFTVEELESYLQSEEFEQLDEISKATLGSYVKKAGDDYTKREVRIDRALSKDITTDTKAAEKKQSNRKTGISKAVDKLTKEEVEQIAELDESDSFDHHKDNARNRKKEGDIVGHHLELHNYYKKHAEEGEYNSSWRGGAGSHRRNLSKANQHLSAARDAVKTQPNKTTHRDANHLLGESYNTQLDEISKSTLGSYVKKASTSLASNAMKAGDRTDKKSDLSFRKAVNRMSGIQIAADKLTKEDMDLNEAEMSHAQILKKIKDGTHEAMTDIKPGKHVELRHTGTGVKKMVFVKPASVK